MAIVKKKEKEQLPPELQEHAEAALYHQVASTYFGDKYKELRGAFFGIIEHAEDVTLEVGKSFQFEHGLFRWQERKNIVVDIEKVAEAIESGKLDLRAALSFAKFQPDAIGALLPDAVSDGTPTAFGVMQANADFKKQIIESLENVREEILAAQIPEPVEATVKLQTQTRE